MFVKRDFIIGTMYGLTSTGALKEDLKPVNRIRTALISIWTNEIIYHVPLFESPNQRGARNQICQLFPEKELVIMDHWKVADDGTVRLMND